MRVGGSSVVVRVGRVRLAGEERGEGSGAYAAAVAVGVGGRKGTGITVASLGRRGTISSAGSLVSLSSRRRQLQLQV